MRPPLAAALLVLFFGVLTAPTASAREELGEDLGTRLVNAQFIREARSALARPGTSAVGDTTYVGFVPGKVTSTNYWGIGTGNFRPYSSDPADYGYWGFDNDAIHDNIGSGGRLAYSYNVLANIFGKICQIAGNPPITTDVPNNPSGREFVDFMNLRNNPLISGRATVDFGLARADGVEVKVFDVSGRLVRTLADRSFAPGRHSLTWDGADSEGRQVARGVYFTQVRYRDGGFSEARKLTVLR